MNTGVHNVRGIELNGYAAELARVTVWIGEIQWMLRHGVPPSKDPILKPLDTIECRDALIDAGGRDANWPDANAIIGNPPFLGNKRMIAELGENNTDAIRTLFRDRLPSGVDLVTYWFERARAQIVAGTCERAGLVTTQSIRKGANRTVMDRIVASTKIFDAWQDEPWVNEGAAVRVSLVAFGNASTTRLNGTPTTHIHADLTSQSAGVDITKARTLKDNASIIYQGTIKVGEFELPGEQAREWLTFPNPNGRSNADVLRPWANGQDLTGRPSDTWIIDFGTSMTEDAAAQYEAPFEHVRRAVKPHRDSVRRDGHRRYWWRHAEARPGMRRALSPLARFIATPRVSKHRFFVWLPVAVLPDSRLYAICRDDDPAFGVLSSRLHEVWALANASRHGVGNDPTYNAGTCFEAFPFPEGLTPNLHPDAYTNPHARAVAIGGSKLNELRENWLNPAEWVNRTAEVVPSYPERMLAKPGHEGDLKKRTLTNLYNAMPTWLQNAHRELDAAVALAYGWKDYTAEMADDKILSRLLALNLQRPAA
jgi:type II restriction/modification system DNA methylase subunit YeeA